MPTLHFALVFLISLTPSCLSWTIPTHLDLSWPPRWTSGSGDRYMTKNGTFLSPNYLDSCLNDVVPSNVTRTQFPVENGRLIFDLTNKTTGNPEKESFSIDIYFPHLYYKYLEPTDYNTGVQNTYKSAVTMRRIFNWQNFDDGAKCFVPLNMTEQIVDKDGNALTASDLVGLKVTVALQIKNGRGYRVFEEVDQCTYLTLTADDGVMPVQDAVPCAIYDPKSTTPTLSPSGPAETPSPTGSAAAHTLIMSSIWAVVMLLAHFGNRSII